MYNNQDILKKHTALTLSSRDVDTSFILFPVRLETRFVNNYPVEDISEPDRALYAFRSLWHYVEGLRNGNSESVLRERANKLMERVESLDTVYREDRARLANLAGKIVQATKPTGELARIWDRIQTHIPRLATLDVVSDNEATEFLRKLDFVDRTIRRMVSKPDYNGKLRTVENASYSQTAKYKAARRHLKKCLPVLEQLLPQDPEKTIVNRFSHITKKQFRKYERVTRFFLSVDKEALLETYHPKDLPASVQQKIKPIQDGLDRDIDRYDDYYERFMGGEGEYDEVQRRQSLRDKMLSKVGRYHHYTLFAEKMILWSLRMATSKRDIVTPQRLVSWRELASSTIFSFHEERTWLLSVLETFNAVEQKKYGDSNRRISPERLNKNNRFIRNRKLSYRKSMKCLLIRVYPDQVAVTQMSKGLSADEILHARLFWMNYFHASKELEREAAWKSLCSLYPAPRAAYIARKQFPNDLPALKAFDMADIDEKTGYSWMNIYFPDIAPVEDADMFPVPLTELMPDRFVVQAKLDNGDKDSYTIVQYGRLIPKSLQVGLDLNNQPEVTETPSGLKLGGAIRWMTDYAEAERMGMAITIPLESFKYDHYTKKQLLNAKAAGKTDLQLKPREFLFTSVYVMGMKQFDPENRKDSRICSQLLQDVFNAHLYAGEGLDLLKIGTPTNILDNDESENSSFDTGEEAQIKDYYKKSIVPLENYVRAGRMNGDADLLSYLFGISSLKPRYKDNPFLNTANRDNVEILKQQMVNEAFLEVMPDLLKVQVGDELLAHPLLSLFTKKAEKNNARENGLWNYFIKDVSPLGVFPSFRIGDQPYGIVPVCDFQNLRYRKGDPLYLVRNLLLYLTEKWNSLAHTAVISEENMYQTKDSKLTTEERYLQAVGGTPYSSTFYMRRSVSDPEMLDPNYFNYIRKGNEDPLSTLRTIVKKLYPKLQRSEFIQKYFPDYSDLFVSDSGSEQVLDAFDWGTIKRSIRTALKEKMHGGDRLENFFRDDKELEMYITGTFDLFNYRLDAWLTGLLKQRLGERMHYTKTHKIAIGAYGWVFNLKEDPSETASNEYIIAPSINQAITAAVLRSSFARSAEGSTQDYTLNVNLSSYRVRQALRIIDGVRNGLSVGAVLGSDLERALHEEHDKSGLEMDFFIYYLRQAYPLSSPHRSTLEAANNAGADKGFRDATIDVLNGSALLDDFRNVRDTDARKKQLSTLYPFDEKNVKSNMWLKLEKIFCTQDHGEIKGYFEYDEETKKKQFFKQKFIKLITLIQEMEDAYDALADVVTSESVYKLTMGNREAVDALMGSLQSGRNIPEPEVTEIPLTSAHIEQRVFVAMDPTVKADDGDVSILRKTEPGLDQWIGQVLGFDRLVFPVLEGKKITQVSLAELGVSPSELVYLSGDWDRFRNFLEVVYWLENPTLSKAGASLGTNRLTGPADLKKGVVVDPIALDEAEWAVDSMREMLAKSRELRQNDLVVTTEPVEDELDRTRQMNARYDLVRKYVSTVADTLFALAADRIVDEKTQAVLQKPGSLVRYFEENPYLPLTDKQLRQCFELLLQCFRCGVFDALSGVDKALYLEKVDRFQSPTEYAELLQRQKDLVGQMGHLSVVLRDRIAKADALRYDKDDPSSTEAIKQLLPSSFRVLLPFRVDHNALIDVEKLEKQKDPNWFGGDTVQKVENELIGLADVRTQLDALHQVRMFARWNGIDAPAEVTAMQLDTAESDSHHWLGTKVEKEEYVHDANVYTVLNAAPFLQKHPASGKYLDAAGLLIDFWVEKIPYRRQTAALAFGYDQPDAEPPQAILVGVSTLGGTHYWSEKRMIKTIRSAMHQVQSRAVEPEHLYADPWTAVLFPLLRIKEEALGTQTANKSTR